MLIKKGNLTILTDPGTWTTAQNELTGINLILITHEHQDHLHIESVKKILTNNPTAIIITNRGVGEILKKEGIGYELLEDGGTNTIQNVKLEGHGDTHGLVHPDIPNVVNTGYFIGERFYYPGDAFAQPKSSPEILALPVSGPWVYMRDCIEFARALKPKTAFPVHDGFLAFGGPFHAVPKKLLEPQGIEFRVPELGKEMEF